jgi:hypothetical protein
MRQGTNGMDIILTGTARSGTSLTCALINRLPQSVALLEPMNPGSLAGLSPAECVLRITEYFAEQRSSLLSSGIATSKALDGVIPENTYGTTRGADGLRTSVVQSQQVHFSKDLLPGFRLVIKHPGFFTAILEPLRQSFECFAVVRNPLSMLLSWHSCKVNVNRGRVPAAEAFDHALRGALDAEPDRIERQMLILQWFYSRYSSLLPRERVIRYEDVVDSGGRALSVMDPDAGTLDVKLESMNLSSRYDPSLVRLLADRLIRSKAAFAEYYPVSAIEELRDRWLDRAT